MRKRFLLFAPLALLAFALFIAFGGWVVMSLWNWLLPSLFGWPALTFWQALGLLALCRILFGGFGFRGPRRSRRWERMTPEERERFRQGMRARCGFARPEGESGGESPV
ncbi:MAG TPA: hypothetical protein VH394_03560 [Thermoanaerobaculia bacterium]|jgi:hypothetical protein|nr:hypothetical protein [Thermoanaerobaculia bacterium]